MLKRFLSLVLAFVMVFSLLPVQALAEGISEAAVTEPAVTEPVETEPEATEPEVTEPEETEPEATEPEVTEPEETEPEVTEPEVTEPEVTEPEVTEPEVTEPEVTEPEVTEPEVTEPEVTEPEVTEPEVTEPVYVSSEETASREARNAATISGTNLTWELTDGVLTISGYGKMTNFSSETKAPWYSRASEIVSIDIGSSVTSIGDFAFKYCSNLRSVDIAGSVSSIGESAFAICTSLTDVTIRNGVATIGKNAFTVCTALKTVTLPQSVTTINNQAFEECTALNTLVISSSAPAIGYSVFRYCDALKDVYYAGTEINWRNLENRPTGVTRVHYSCSGPEGHWESVSVDATCGADGYTADVCTCAVPYTKNTVVTGTATGNHDFTSSDVCSVCGQTNNTCGDNLTWTLEGGTLTISGTGPMDDFDAALESDTPAAPWDERREEITAVVIGENVTAIGSDAFWDCSNMTSIDLPDSLISIGEYAFKGCRGLTSIELPDSLTTIGKLAFSECTGLTGISLPARLTSLVDGAFFYCSGLTSIEIPSGVTVLGQTMFYNCTRLQRIYLPRTLTSIDATAFGLCSALTDVYYAGTETAWSSVSGIGSQHLASAIMHYAYLCEDGHDYADGTCTNCGAENPVISGTCGENLTWELDETTGVLTISGSGAMTDFLFQDTPWYANREDITQVVIGNGVTTIGEFAFEDFFNLTDVTISNSVTSIGAYAFCYCESLKTVSIPDSVTTIGTQAFAECTALESIRLPSGLTAIPIALFCNCYSLESIELPAGVTTIGEAAFDYASQLKDVYFAGTEAAWQNISIGEDNSSLDNATIHYAYLCTDGHDYADGTCTNCGAENPVISGTCGDNLSWELDEESGVLTISGTGEMFNYDGENNTAPWYDLRLSIRSIVMEDGITRIGNAAFFGCDSLTSVDIPNSVVTIGKNAFSACHNLTSVMIPASVTTMEYAAEYYGNVFTECESLTGIWVDENNPNYSSDSRGVLFNKDKTLLIEAPCAMSGSYHIPDSVTRIHECAFFACAVSNVTMGDNMTSIGTSAFQASGLTSITIGNGVTSIGDSVFTWCDNLTSVEVPDSVTNLEGAPFWSCWGLTSITLGKGITTLEECSFCFCDNLNSIYFRGDAPLFADDSFFGFGSATAYYPAGNETWTSDKLQTYGGDITWQAYCNHDFTEVADEKYLASAATCTDPAIYYKSCQCGETSTETFEYGTSTGHAFNYNTHKCSTCGHIGGTCGDNLTWELDETTGVLTISGEGDMQDYSYGNAPWFSYYQNTVKKVVLESGITRIGNYAFYCLFNLEEVTIPDTVTAIGNSAFYNTNLTTVAFPDILTSIGNYAFEECAGLTEISIPESVTSIGALAFGYCDLLTDITFRHTAEDTLQLGDHAFWSSSASPCPTTVRVPYAPRGIHPAITEELSDCNRVPTWVNMETAPITTLAITAEKTSEEMGLPVALRAEVTPYNATSDVVWSVSDPQMGELVADGDNATFTGWKTGTVTVRCASADDASIYSEAELTVLPPTEELTGLSIRVAGDIPNEIELGVPTQMVVDFQPGNAAARDVTWELDDGTGSATIDKNGLVTPLTAGTVIVTATSKEDSDIFATCTVEIIRYVDDVTILLDDQENVTAIGVGQEMSLSAVFSPADAKYQGKDVVWTLENGTGTAELLTTSYPTTVYAIKGKTAGTVILTATSPDSRQCYARVELEVVGEELPYAVSGGNIYYNTRTGFITRADSSVKEAVIPSKIGGTTITGIAADAFSPRDSWGSHNGNTTLTYVKLPDTVTFIGEYAFNYCTSLATLKLGSGVTTIGKRAFYYCESISNLEIPDSATAIGSEAFYGLNGLKKLTLSGELNTSGWLNSYRGYNGDGPLESVTFTGSRIISQPHTINESWTSVTELPGRSAKKIIISDSVTAIEDFAFSSSEMQTLSLGSRITTIGRSAFSSCYSLTSVTLPDSLTFIGKNAFYGCDSLTAIDIGDNISIGEEAFSDSSSLAAVTIGDGASIGEEAFSSCSSLTTVTVGDNASIGMYAFSSCSSLTTVTIGDGSSIGEEAFSNCSNLVTVNLPDNLTHVGKDCFQYCDKLQLFDLSRIPDVIIAKETPLDNMATVPSALVSATGGKVSLYWHCNLADIPENEGRDLWEVAGVHYDGNMKNVRLVSYGTGTIVLSCRDEYTGARGSKEVRIETGIEVRGVPAYLISGKSVTLTAYRMPDNKKEAVYWSLDTEGAKYAKLSTSNASAAVTLTANAATVTSAKQVQLTATPTGGGDEVVVSIWLLPETSDVLIFAGNPDAPADYDALNGETLDIDMHAGNTLQLSALVKPTGALNEVSWKSSATAVAEVSEEGFVTLKKPGTATITATAADGSKESASVKLNVIYLDTVSKLTATVNVPAIGLQPEESATMLVYGEDKTQPLDPKNLTFTIPASQQDIAKVEDGVITAKHTAGTVTVTAAITGDPLGRSVSVKVKVIPSQAVSLQLTPELPASDRPVDMDEQNGTYAISLNTRDAKGQAYTFTIRPKVANSLGETFTPSELNWATTDSRIATVLANNDGSATVTVNADADGACAITATTTDVAQVESELAIYVRDYTPRLESTTLTLNTYLESGASIGLLESYDHYIDSVSIHEYDSATGTYPDQPSQRLSADYADGLLTVTASGFIKNGTIKTQLRVTCDKGRQSEQTHIFNLSIKAASTLPAITVKQPVKFNTKIGTQTALTFTAKNAAVLDVQLDEETSESFLPSGLFDEQTGSLLLDYIPGDVLDTKVEVDIYVDGYRDPIRKAVTIGTTTAMPSVTVKQPAKLNLFYTDSTADLFVTTAGATITDITLDEESTASFEIVDSFDPDTGKLTIGLTGDYLDKLVKLDTSGKLLVELEGYTEPIAKTFTIGTVTTKPALSLTATSSIINTAISCEPSTEFTVYNKTTGENLELDDGDVSTTSNFVEISVAAENRVKLTLTGTSGGTADVSIQQATWTQPVKLSHKITVQTALPAPVLGATTLKLNSLLPDISAQTTVKLNQSNQQIESITFTPIGTEAKKIQLSYADGVITAAFDPAVDSSTLKNGTCRFSYEVTLVETNAEGNPITLPAKTLLVNVSSAAPRVSLSAKGKLDTMNPDSEVLYTVSKLTNISGYIDSVDLSGADSELFSAELDTTGSKPVVKLTMAAADQYDTGKTYKMQLVFTVRQSDDPDSPMHKVPADISFKVSQSAVKFAAVPAGKLYQFQDSVSFTVALTTPVTAALDDITLDTGKTAAAFLRAMGDGNMLVDIAPDGRSALVTFEINSPAYLTYGKSYTVYVNAEPENLSTNSKPTQLKLTLKTYK